jgi:hypothetical protein
MQSLFKWVASKISPEKKAPKKTYRQTAFKGKPRPVVQRHPSIETVDFDAELGGKIEDGGPGKNVLVRNKYVREDTGTHETLTIIDDTLVDDEEAGLDPYNTGRFDRSKSWDSSRSRK